MEPMEEVFRDGLRDAVSSQPVTAPIELDEVLARAALPAGPRYPAARWIGLAAAVSLAAGLGLWAVQSGRAVPGDGVSGTPARTQVQTLRVHNGTRVAYHRAALQLADGRTLPLGDVPAGGTVVVPLDARSTPVALPSGPVEVSGPPGGGLRVLYSGVCAASDGGVVVVASGSGGDDVTIQIVAASGPSAADSSSIISATVVPASQPGTPSASSFPQTTSPAPGVGPTSSAPSGALPVCTITVAEALPSPDPTHS